MASDLQQNYLERDILEAGGCRLVVLLYESALQSIEEARRHLGRGEIRERSRAITRASEVLNELALAVDHDTGGELGKSLVELYDYVQSLLLKANAEQVEDPLKEAGSLLETLLEAWRLCEKQEVTPVAAQDAEAAGYEEYAPINCVG